MGMLTDVAIRAWIRSGERFEGRSDGDGLVLTWRPERRAPSWKLRCRFAGKSRVNLGSHTDLPLTAARQSAKELRAKIALEQGQQVRLLTGVRERVAGRHLREAAGQVRRLRAPRADPGHVPNALRSPRRPSHRRGVSAADR